MDRTTKFLLFMIALGLWLNLWQPAVQAQRRPPADDQVWILKNIDTNTVAIRALLETLVEGKPGCKNPKICG